MDAPLGRCEYNPRTLATQAFDLEDFERDENQEHSFRRRVESSPTTMLDVDSGSARWDI